MSETANNFSGFGEIESPVDPLIVHAVTQTVEAEQAVKQSGGSLDTVADSAIEQATAAILAEEVVSLDDYRSRYDEELLRKYPESYWLKLMEPKILDSESPFIDSGALEYYEAILFKSNYRALVGNVNAALAQFEKTIFIGEESAEPTNMPGVIEPVENSVSGEIAQIAIPPESHPLFVKPTRYDAAIALTALAYVANQQGWIK